ncbi:translation initiation factor 2 [Streptomyces roseirectus]|uniref:Translation initiation factor 2 n=1 Tax=Streptomyces roseirectus TaxID=2768066 RepID=A0A7H0IE52_9ACTN|nr:translation initiation factor 2 [Streptomyces roseirectus]QNP71068.1 translation initiation factor 2 [Streptomyces roseirectus]
MRRVLFAARSAVALHRLLDVVPVFAGDARIARCFTLVPGSDFGVDALAVVDALGGRVVPWEEACAGAYDLVVSASPKGELALLSGPHVLLPHGAGFSKTIRAEGSADSASGLDPVYLRRAPIALHAMAHPDQVARLRAAGTGAASRARVVGDPTLDRLLASRPLRDRYRAALGTGSRRLLVLTSTWGPESLLHRRPDLPAELAAELPYDEYQLALVVHPNEHSRLGAYDLAERLAPAFDAGLVLAAPREEWAAVLVAADALVTDHGSTALYFAGSAADDRPVVGVGSGGPELIPGSPMDELLRSVPVLGRGQEIRRALDAYRPGAARHAAEAAFAFPGRALERLRAELYGLLGLTPAAATSPRLLPSPAPARRMPAAFDVHAGLIPDGVRVARHPVGLAPAGHHLAVEYGAAGEQVTLSAGVLYRRPLPSGAGWTSGGWTRHALDSYPGCRTAGVVQPCGDGVLRFRGRELPYAVRIEARVEADGRVSAVDPAVAVSAAHVWVAGHRDWDGGRVVFNCLVGEREFRVRLREATEGEAGAAV